MEVNQTLLCTTPIELPCGVALSNRLAKAAMTEGLATPTGQPTERHNTLYRRWSEGGAGLHITGNVMVDGRYLERGGNAVLEDESALAAYRAWAKAGTAAGNHLWMQLNHPGRQCARMVNTRPVSPSDVQLELLGNFAKPRALLESEIENIIQRFARTALLAKQAGFTGVQIHSAHGYLGSQFLSPLTNLRKDQWGGTLANRARFLRTTIAAVRASVGASFPVSVKLNSSDFQKGGFSFEDCVQVAQWIAEAGVDLLEISGGTYEQLAFMAPDAVDEVRESTRKREAFFVQYAQRLRQSLKQIGSSMPLMVTGGFRTLEGVESALQLDATDVIGLGRPLCVQTDFPTRLINNQAPDLHDLEKGLVLGKGYWGHNSPSSSVRAINNQGQAGWYYRQIERIADGQEPILDGGVLAAFIRYIGADMVRNIKRALAR